MLLILLGIIGYSVVVVLLYSITYVVSLENKSIKEKQDEFKFILFFPIYYSVLGICYFYIFLFKGLVKFFKLFKKKKVKK